jgi:hypothetical protein
MKKRRRRKEKPIEKVAFAAAWLAFMYQEKCLFSPDRISREKRVAKLQGIDYEDSMKKMRVELGERLVECADRGLLPDVVRALPKIRRRIFSGHTLWVKYNLAYIRAIRASYSAGRELPTDKEFAYAIFGDASDGPRRIASDIAKRYGLPMERRTKNRK